MKPMLLGKIAFAAISDAKFPEESARIKAEFQALMQATLSLGIRSVTGSVISWAPPVPASPAEMLIQPEQE